MKPFVLAPDDRITLLDAFDLHGWISILLNTALSGRAIVGFPVPHREM